MVYGHLRWCVTFHSTATVNSLAHSDVGSSTHVEKRNKTSARQNLFVAFLTCGEGFHDWHHGLPQDSYGMRGSCIGILINMATWTILFLEFLGFIWDVKRPESYLISETMAEFLPEVATKPCQKTYHVIIKRIGAVRWWLLNRDHIMGLTDIYKHGDLLVIGNFNDFMDDVILCTRRRLSVWQRIDALCFLWLLPSFSYTDTVQPFRSSLQKHSIQRDKDAVAYHYDVNNDFFRCFLSDNMLYTTGVYDDANKLNFHEACENKFKEAHDLLLVNGFDSEYGTLLDFGCGWGGSIAFFSRNHVKNCKGITISHQQVNYANSPNVNYMHYKEENGTYDAITAFQYTEHMPYEELVKFFFWADNHLKPGGILLVEFMTTTKIAKCHMFVDKFIFPDGAQFPLCDAIRACEIRKEMLLQSVKDNSYNYYLTIKEWVKRLELKETECVQALDNNREKYMSFLLYLKWAEFLYIRGRSRCYTCVWKKK